MRPQNCIEGTTQADLGPSNATAGDEIRHGDSSDVSNEMLGNCRKSFARTRWTKVRLVLGPLSEQIHGNDTG